MLFNERPPQHVDAIATGLLSEIAEGYIMFLGWVAGAPFNYFSFTEDDSRLSIQGGPTLFMR